MPHTSALVRLEQRAPGAPVGAAAMRSTLLQLDFYLGRPVTMLGLSVQGLARQANVQRPEGFATDVDFSGGSIRAGIRGHWGGRDE